MSERVYRFMPAMEPEAYAVIDIASGCRVPGIVRRDDKGIVTYTRERPNPRKGGRKIIETFSTETVARMSELLVEYFTGNPIEPEETSQCPLFPKAS